MQPWLFAVGCAHRTAPARSLDGLRAADPHLCCAYRSVDECHDAPGCELDLIPICPGCGGDMACIPRDPTPACRSEPIHPPDHSWTAVGLSGALDRCVSRAAPGAAVGTVLFAVTIEQWSITAVQILEDTVGLPAVSACAIEALSALSTSMPRDTTQLESHLGWFIYPDAAHRTKQRRQLEHALEELVGAP